MIQKRKACTRFVSILRGSEKLPQTDPEVVSVGTAVCYREEGDANVRWHLIEDEPDPVADRDEFSPSHQWSVALCGLKRGDSVTLRDGPALGRKASIVDIWSKYKYRFNQCGDEWERRFSQHPFLFIQRFTQGVDGKPDFGPIFRSIDDQYAAVEQRDKVYREYPQSPTSYAVLSEITVAEAMQHIAASHDLFVRCCKGNSQEELPAKDALDNARPLILDGSALATLFMTGGYRHLRNLNRKILVSWGTLLEWKRLLSSKSSLRDGGRIAKDGEKYVFIQLTAEERIEQSTKIQEFINEIESIAVIEEGLALSDLPIENREFFTEALGRPAVETIALARSNGYALWTDDQWVGEVAATFNTIPRVWTQIVFDWWQLHAPEIKDEASDISLLLLRWKYFYTGVSHDAFIRAAEKDAWSCSGPSLAACLEWCSNPFTNQRYMIDFIEAGLTRLHHTTKSKLHQTTVGSSLLSAVEKRPDGNGILKKIAGRLIAKGEFDETAALIRDLMAVWKHVQDTI